MKLLASVGAVAIALTAAIAAQAPPSPESLLKAAQQRELVDGDITGALTLFESIVEKFPTSAAAPDALMRASRIHESRGNVLRAREGYERILKQFPRATSAVANARERLAVLDRQRGQVRQHSLLAGEAANQFWGTVAPDGRSIAYCDFPSVSIWDLQTARGRPLTKPPSNEGPCEFALLSPDGRSVVYSWWNARAIELRVVPVEGGTPRVLFRDESVGWLQPRSWSPDGAGVLFIAEIRAVNQGRRRARDTPPDWRLNLVSVGSAETQTLQRFGMTRPDHALFSPNGRFIAFDAWQNGSAQRDIFLMASGGGDYRPLEVDSSDDFLLGWSPRSNALVFSSDRLGNAGAWMRDVLNGEPGGPARLIKSDIGVAETLGVSRDGSLFYYVTHAATDVYVAEIDPVTGTLIEALRPLRGAQPGVRRNQATWAPDNDRIVYFRRAEGQSLNLVVQNVRSGAVNAFPVSIHNAERPSWSQDGKSVVVEAADDTGARSIYRVDLTTGGVEPIAPQGLFPYLLPGENTLVYRHPGEGGPGTWRRDLGTGAEVRIGHPPVGALALSPDARLLGQTVDRQSPTRKIIVFPTSGGEPRVLADNLGPLAHELAWGGGPNGGFLYYATTRPWQLWRVPAGGESPQKLAVEINAEHLSVSADGRRIAVSGGSARLEVFKLENIPWAGVR